MAVAFRLGRVLRLRETLRRHKQHEVSEVLGRRRGVESQRRRATIERARVLEAEADAAAAMVLDPAFLRLSRQFEAALAETEAELAAAAVELDRVLAEKRAELVHERREERKLEQLAERHRARVALDDAWRIDRELDELAIAAHRRRASEEKRRGDRS